MIKKLSFFLLFSLFLSSCSTFHQNKTCTSSWLIKGEKTPIENDRIFIVMKDSFTTKEDVDFIVRGQKLNDVLTQLKEKQKGKTIEFKEVHFQLKDETAPVYFRAVILNDLFFSLEASRCQTKDSLTESFL